MGLWKKRFLVAGLVVIFRISSVFAGEVPKECYINGNYSTNHLWQIIYDFLNTFKVVDSTAIADKIVDKYFNLNQEGKWIKVYHERYSSYAGPKHYKQIDANYGEENNPKMRAVLNEFQADLIQEAQLPQSNAYDLSYLIHFVLMSEHSKMKYIELKTTEMMKEEERA